MHFRTRIFNKTFLPVNFYSLRDDFKRLEDRNDLFPGYSMPVYSIRGGQIDSPSRKTLGDNLSRDTGSKLSV